MEPGLLARAQGAEVNCRKHPGAHICSCDPHSWHWVIAQVTKKGREVFGRLVAVRFGEWVDQVQSDGKVLRIFGDFYAAETMIFV